MLVTAILVSATVCGRPGNAAASTIAQVETFAGGTAATLDQNPVITYIASQPGTGDGYTYTNYAILANDGTGSIDLFGSLPTGSPYVPAVGDAITVSGTYSPFNSIGSHLPCHGIGAGQSDYPVLRRDQSQTDRSADVVYWRLLGRPACASIRDRPPQSEARGSSGLQQEPEKLVHKGNSV